MPTLPLSHARLPPLPKPIQADIEFPSGRAETGDSRRSSGPGITFSALFAANFGKTPALWAKGVSGQSLSATLSLYNGRTEKISATWVHFQESGDQDEAGQRTSAEFGATFESMVRVVRTGSPNALISTVILPDGGHYAAVGNLMVALSYFDALGFDVAKVNLAAVPEVSAAHKTACLEIIAKY